MVPRRVHSKSIARSAGTIECHIYFASGEASLARDAGGIDAVGCQDGQRLRAQIVDANSADQRRVGAKRCGMAGEIRGSSAKARSVRIHIPQHFSNRGNNRPLLHAATPSCFWISSSGTPLVSGTIVRTQISCSTIMKQKNVKM